MEFRILGTLEVGDDARLLDLGGTRQRELLSILLLRRGTVVSADQLVEDLYGTHPPATAAKSLQAHVSRLRKVLGPGERLITRGSGYMFDVTEDDVDVDLFERLLGDGRRALAAGEADAAEHALERALALLRGAPFADLAYHDVAQGEIARVAELQLAALEELLEARLELGRHVELVPELERLAVQYPLRERLRGQLMVALYRSSRQAEALSVYQDGRRELTEELGIDPGRALQDLERAILNQDSRLDLPIHSDGEEPVRAGRLAAGIFVGRERELSLLEDALADARAGRGRLAVLAGEAGIGKSRLADELAASAKVDGTRVLWGRCWEAGGAPAYWPWVQALRAHVRDSEPEALRGELGAAAEVAHLLPEVRELYTDIPKTLSLDTEGARFRLFDSTAAFIRRAAAPSGLLIVLDDMHAADAPSLLLLEFVAAELADARVLVLATYRDPELETGDPIAVALAGITRLASLRISLHGLDRPEVISYIGQSSHREPDPSVVAAIMAETEGNPLFVGEIVRLLAVEGRLGTRIDPTWRLSIPETVKEVIGHRVKTLSTECRDVLALASVVGREFQLDVVARLADLTRDEVLALLDEAEAARVVSDVPASPGQMRFTHALVRDTLYDALPQGRRLELHRRTGDALEELTGLDASAHLSELAHHFYSALPAVEPEKVVSYARRAGDHAGALLAHEEAARLYEIGLQALALSPVAGQDLEPTLLLSLGDALSRAGDMPRAKDTFLRVAARARASASAEDLAAAALGYSGRAVWSRPGSDQLVVSLLEEALAALGDEDTPQRTRILARLGGALRDEPDPARRIAIGKLAVATARRSGDPAALSYALRGLCAAQHALGDHEERLTVAGELRELARTMGDKEAECEALTAEQLVYAERNEFDLLRSSTADRTALATELHQPTFLWFAVTVEVMLALREGLFADVERSLPEALEIGTRPHADMAAAVYATHLYLLRREQGRADEALEALSRVAAENSARPVFRCALAALSVDLGHIAEARRLFEELATNAFEVVPRDNEWLLASAFLVETCRALDDITRAEVLYDQLLPLADRSTADVAEGALGAMAGCLGVLAAMLGRTEDAILHLRAAIEIDTATGGRPWVAYAQVELADLLVTTGDAAESAALRRDAAATAAELGMERLRARIEAGIERCSG